MEKNGMSMMNATEMNGMFLLIEKMEYLSFRCFERREWNVDNLI